MKTDGVKKLVLVILFLLTALLLNADSITMGTTITSVANGVNDFGMGLFPISMTYCHNKSFQLIPEYGKKATFYGIASFSISNSSLDYNYDHFDGTPKWALSSKEALNHSFFPSASLKRTYFSPYAYFDLSLSQPLGVKKNPVSGGDLLTLKVGFYSRYEMALENTLLSISPSNSLYEDSIQPIFVDKIGNPIAPFTDNHTLKAFPWLEGDRKAFNNYLYITATSNLYKSTGLSTYDGASVSLGLEYGPSWLFNKMNNGVVSSNYVKAYGSVTEKITLYVDKQEDGKSWLTSHLGHTNSFGYTFGDVVPQHKIPTDRLRGYFYDQLWLNVTFPQFIATDCYAYIQVGLNNYLYFGKVANEVSSEHSAVELVSNVTGTFHMRLFNFVRFQYNVSYTFNRGIWSSQPAWSQNAELRFWVSL